MIDVDNVIMLLNDGIDDKIKMIEEIDKELEEMETRKIQLLDKRSSANFFIDKLSKKVDIIERAKRSDKPFEEIHPRFCSSEK